MALTLMVSLQAGIGSRSSLFGSLNDLHQAQSWSAISRDPPRAPGSGIIPCAPGPPTLDPKPARPGAIPLSRRCRSISAGIGWGPRVPKEIRDPVPKGAAAEHWNFMAKRKNQHSWIEMGSRDE